jgi:hypothetical protein
VVLELARDEVGAEAAAGARRDSPRAQNRDGEHREIAADPDQSILEPAGRGERPPVAEEQAVEHLRDGADVGFGPALGRELLPVARGPVLVQQEALHRAGDRCRIAGQRLQQGRVASRRGHAPGARVEVEDLPGRRAFAFRREFPCR